MSLEALIARDFPWDFSDGAYVRGCCNYAALLAAEGQVTCAILWFKRALASAPEPTRNHMLATLAHHEEPAIRALAEPPLTE